MSNFIKNIFNAASILSLTGVNDLNARLGSQQRPAVIDVYAEYCGYSKMMAQPFADLAKTNAGEVDFWGSDAMVAMDISTQYNVKGLPTFLGFACGKKQAEVAGADEEGLKAMLQSLKSIKC